VNPSAGRAPADLKTIVRYWTVVVTHFVCDIYAIIFVALMHVLVSDFDLSGTQIVILYAIGPLFSGPPQIFFAWLGDRFDTRVFGPIGLVVGAVCMSSIGFAQTYEQLIALEIIGVMGIGAYHPIAVSLAGQLGGRVLKHGRAFAVSIFFTAGMFGHSFGPFISSRMNHEYGLKSLVWLIIPAIFAAVALAALTNKAGHRAENHLEARALISDRDRKFRWLIVALLALQNALRYTAHISLMVIANLWAGSVILDNPDHASILGSNILIWLTVGMGVSSLVAGRMIKTGHEKWPVVITTLLGSVVIATTGFVGREIGVWAILAASCLGAVGFASVIPTCIATAQRLLPSNTGVVSALMMGMGWGISAIGTWLVPNVFVRADLENVAQIPARQVDMGYIWIAGLVFLAGLICLAIPSKTLLESAREAGTEGDPEHLETLRIDPEP